MDIFKNIMDEANARADKETQFKVYEYVILDRNFDRTDKKGRCYITNRYYDPCMDYNVISFKDIDTGEKYRKCQFYVEFSEVK